MNKKVLKVTEVIHELELSVYLLGSSFYISEAGGLFCSCQSPGEVISLCHQHCNLAEQWPSALILFHYGKNHLCMSVSHWAGDYRRAQFHQHWICPADTRWLFWAVLHFSSPSLLGYTVALCPDIVLYTRLYFLKTVDPAIWSLKTIDT